MAVVEHLRTVYFHLQVVVKGIGDVPQVQMEKDLGVPQKLIQKEISRHGQDATNTAKKIKVSKLNIFIHHLILYLQTCIF